MKSFRRIRCSLFLILLVCGCAYPTQMQLPAPSLLPHTDRMMRTPGFWTSRYPDADQVVLSEIQIADFNSETRAAKLTTDIALLPQKLSPQDVAIEIQNEFKHFAGKKFYRSDGSLADQAFFDEIKSNLSAGSFGKEPGFRFGFIVHYANQRLLPTDTALLEKPGDVDFDELQNSALDVGTPVAVLAESRDAKWFYCSSQASAGWIRKEFVAFADVDQIKAQDEKPFVVVTSAKADLFLDVNLTKYYDYAQMGTRLVLLGEAKPGVLKVSLALRQPDGSVNFQDGFVKGEDVHSGYLTYTSRVVIEQAFKLLNAPYGWGGMYGEQDCSRFVQQLFATVGIHLPRNSGAQAKVGKNLARFDEKTALPDKLKILQTQAVPGITLLGMKGHIMLYLGVVDGNPYAIHATWAYREMKGGQEIIRVINQVTVSDLSLGKGSQKGSLLERLRVILLVASR